MREIFENKELCEQRIAEIDLLMQFPDLHSNTLTYAVPQQDEEGVWFIEVGSDVINKESNEEVVEQTNLESTEQVGYVAE